MVLADFDREMNQQFAAMPAPRVYVKLNGHMVMSRRSEEAYYAQVQKVEIVDSADKGLKESVTTCSILANEAINEDRKGSKGGSRATSGRASARPKTKAISKAGKGGRKKK